MVQMAENFSDDDLFVFAEEESFDSSQPDINVMSWKVLVVDDEEEVHGVTDMVLRDIVFEDRPLEIISAYSGKDARAAFEKHDDIAIVLLDVVMEKDTAGLDTVRYIRRELCNHTSRIVLRTGQPGVAPERSVILEYDINDYREKTELTAQKLFTTVIAALRNYRDMIQLEKNRQGMQKVIESSAIIFGNQSLRPFSINVLNQLCAMFDSECHGGNGCFGFVAADSSLGLRVIAGNGEYVNSVDSEVPHSSIEFIKEALIKKESIFYENVFIGYFESKHGARNILFLEGIRGLNDMDLDLIRVFCNNIAIAYENIYLNIDIIDTQKDIILRMGDVVETRSRETANHVYRVAEYSYLIALHVGLGEERANILRHASPMHDVGKVGVPDDILLKPDKLTEDEFAIMKTHTTLGYNIFKSSPREIVQAAAIIAHEHHERWDGNGYPRGLKGDEIHVYGRITTLADIFDALASKRSYKEAWEFEDVFTYIKENKGLIFDPALVDAFWELKDQLLEIRELYPDT